MRHKFTASDAAAGLSHRDKLSDEAWTSRRSSREIAYRPFAAVETTSSAANVPLPRPTKRMGPGCPPFKSRPRPMASEIRDAASALDAVFESWGR